MEDEERERYMQQRHKKIVAAEATLIQKQANEMNALRKKIETGMNERLKQREIEHNKYVIYHESIITIKQQASTEILKREEGT